MAKHLPPFNLLKGLLLAICLSIIAALPAAAALPSAPEDTKPSLDSIKVTKDPVLVIDGRYVHLKALILSGIVEGIELKDWQDFEPSCDYSGIKCNKNSFYASSYMWEPCVITYTNINDPEIKFDLRVQAFRSASDAISSNSIVLEGETKTIEVPLRNGYMPLSEYESIELLPINDQGPDPSDILRLDIDTEKNTLTFEGLKTGNVYLRFSHQLPNYHLPEIVRIHVGENTSEIKVKADKYFHPYLNSSIQLRNLVLGGEIEGVSLDECSKFIPSCNDSSLTIVRIGTQYCGVQPTQYKDYTVTYTHSENPEKNSTSIILSGKRLIG